MSKISLNNISNANVYIDGVNLLGRAASIKLPEVTAIMAERKSLGMIGKLKLPSGGFEPLEGDIVWNSFYPEAAKHMANPMQSVQLQCRSSVDKFDSTGRSAEKELVTIMTVSFHKNPLGDFKHLENAEFSSSYTATFVKQIFDGEEILEIDFLSNIYKVGGVDQLGAYRNNIGG
ncbi:phage major tail tube protein [Sapientia aquatica]|uniref:Phage major tail tube protein n=1 Tax=Sapientia aquatica TaxID=1549640 RepID=A0A4R5W2I1_9BURK|nr:phage major tail tube protein [Sapientia aquatica]TDK65977.1 phage major tail tube protein [Sapientia aquatica]